MIKPQLQAKVEDLDLFGYGGYVRGRVVWVDERVEAVEEDDATRAFVSEEGCG